VTGPNEDDWPATLDDEGVLATAYQRLAAMDPPALRELLIELERQSRDHLAVSGLIPSAPARARAAQAARRVVAAQHALLVAPDPQ